MVDEILSESKKAMQKTIEAFRHEISSVRTGRANPSLLEHIRVEYYGSTVPLNQVATVGIPEPRMITVQPWDKSAIGPIEKAILSSSLGIQPSNDGTMIRLPIPQLTEERRKDLVKQVRNMAEDVRVSIRNARRDANDLLKEAQKEGEIPEDDSKRGQDQTQKLTDEHIQLIETILKEKESEIMEI
jgi:ribosome recycling factor